MPADKGFFPFICDEKSNMREAADFIDPDAAEKHAHSKQLDAFFKQHIGFFSDDDADDHWKGPNQGHASPISPLSSPGTDTPKDEGEAKFVEQQDQSVESSLKDSPDVPCLVLSESEDSPQQSAGTLNTDDMAEGTAWQEQDVNETITQAVHQQQESAPPPETELPDQQPSSLQEDTEESFCPQDESAVLSQPQDEEVLGDSPSADDEDFKDAEQEQLEESSPDSTRSAFVDTEDAVRPEAAQELSPVHDTENRSLPSSDHPDQLTDKRQTSNESSAASPAADRRPVGDDPKAAGTEGAVAGHAVPKSATNQTQKDVTKPQTTGKPKQDHPGKETTAQTKGGTECTAKKESKPDKGQNPGQKEKGDNGEKVKGEAKDKGDKPQDSVKKRASTGAQQGENTSSTSGADGSERPESCVVS